MKNLLAYFLRWPSWSHRAIVCALCALVFVWGGWSAFTRYFPLGPIETILVSLVQQHTGMALNLHAMYFDGLSLTMKNVGLRQENGIVLSFEEAVISPHFFPLGVEFHGMLSKRQGEINLLIPLDRTAQGWLRASLLGRALYGGGKIALPNNLHAQPRGHWQVSTRFTRSRGRAFPLQTAQVELQGAQLRMGGAKVINHPLPAVVLSEVVLRAKLSKNRLTIETFRAKGNVAFNIAGSVVINFRNQNQSTLNLKVQVTPELSWLQRLGPFGQIVQAQLASSKTGFLVQGSAASPSISPAK